MKKITLTIIVFFVLLSTITFSEEVQITDLKNHWSEDLIKRNIERGTAINEEALFYPDRELSWADVIRYINIYMGYSDGKKNDENWHILELKIAKDIGYVRDYGDGNLDGIADKDEKYLHPATVQDVVRIINELISIRTSHEFKSNRVFSEFTAITFDSSQEIVEDIRIRNFIDSEILSLENGVIDPMRIVTKAEFYKIMDNIFGEILSDSESFEKVYNDDYNKSIAYSDFRMENKAINSDIVLLPSVTGDISLVNCDIKGTLYIMSSRIKSLNIEGSHIENIIFSSRGYWEKEVVVNINDYSSISGVLYTQKFVQEINVSETSTVNRQINYDQVPGARSTDPRKMHYIFYEGDVFSNYTYNDAKRYLKIYSENDEEIHIINGREFLNNEEELPVKIVDGDNFKYYFYYDIWRDGKEASYAFYNSESGKYTINFSIKDTFYNNSNKISKIVIISNLELDAKESARIEKEKEESIRREKEKVEEAKMIEREKELSEQSNSTEIVTIENLDEVKSEEKVKSNIEKRIDETTDELLVFLKNLPVDNDRSEFEYYNDLRSAIDDVGDCIYVLTTYYNVDLETIEALENFERYGIAKETSSNWKNEMDSDAEQYAKDTRDGFMNHIIFWLDKLPEDEEIAKKTTDIDVLIRDVDAIEGSIESFTNWEGDINEILDLNNYYRLSVAKERISQIRDMSASDLKLINKMNEKLKHYELTNIIPSGDWYREILEFEKDIDKLSASQRSMLNNENVNRVYEYIENAPDFAIAEYEFQNNEEEYFEYLSEGENRIYIPESMSVSFQDEYRKKLEDMVLKFFNNGTYYYKVASHGYNGGDPTEYLVVLVDESNDIELLLVIKTKQLFDYEDKSRYFGQ